MGKFLPKDDEIPETPVKGDRTPSMRIPVTISMDWVEISGVDSNDILTYGIYDLDGGCMGIFNDAPSFTDIFFSLSGEYELRFTTDEYLYIGYVEL
ncbi:MAG: hypothetical protein K2J70_07275 [Muribaculaceae bacterium]|nr:hypothetical protein [Muribaculaceae bacterium]